jgi:hypothetical protein
MGLRGGDAADESRLLRVTLWLLQLSMLATDASGAPCRD